MEVLSLGFSRTGTMTMKTALDILGIPTSHWITQAQNINDLAMWTDGLRAKWEPGKWPHLAHRQGKPYGRAEFDALLAHYGACTDQPAYLLAEELVPAYPDAKVVLCERDEDNWYRSFCNTTITSATNPWIPLATKLDPTYMYYFAIQLNYVATYKMGVPVSRTRGPWGLRNNPEFPVAYRKVAREGYRRHNELIKSIVPEERLLKFKLEDGWGPLCEFLGKPVPDVPFPRVNETESVNELVGVYLTEGYKRGMMRFVKRTAPYAVVLLGMLVAWRLW